MAKTINDIKGRFCELYIKENDLGLAVDILEEELRTYYGTPTGRAEIDATPNKGLPLEIAVDMLMQDVRTYAKTLGKE